MNKEISQTCPKCNKDYSKDPHWKQSLKKHLARKNPCNRKNEKYIREKKKVPSNIFTIDDYYDLPDSFYVYPLLRPTLEPPFPMT